MRPKNAPKADISALGFLICGPRSAAQAVYGVPNPRGPHFLTHKSGGDSIQKTAGQSQERDLPAVFSIPLTKGYVALVDGADYSDLSAYKWMAFTSKATLKVYASRFTRTRGKGKTIFMHRQLVNAPDDLEVDHVNGNGLDNRRSNLRLATHQQNIFNRTKVRKMTSTFKGVSWESGREKWRAGIQVNGQSILLGRFTSEKAAARAYDNAALKHFGGFARLNFPNADYHGAAIEA